MEFARQVAYRTAARVLSALSRWLVTLRRRGVRRLRRYGWCLAAYCEARFRRGSFRVRRGGFVWNLQLEDNLQRSLFVRGSYELDLVRFVCNALKPDDRVLDIGANIGVYTLPLARTLRSLGGGEVLAFEPAVAARRLLQRHICENGLSGSVRVVPYGLAAQGRRAWLRRVGRFDAQDLGVRSLHGDGGACEEIELVQFDDWIGGERIDRIDLIKIDIEGAEYDALCGMKTSLGRYRPRHLVVELREELMLRAGSTTAGVVELLASFGYAPFVLEGGRLRSWRRGLPDPNAIFVLDGAPRTL